MPGTLERGRHRNSSETLVEGRERAARQIQEKESSQHSKPKNQTATAEGGCVTQAIHPQHLNYSLYDAVS